MSAEETTKSNGIPDSRVSKGPILLQKKKPPPPPKKHPLVATSGQEPTSAGTPKSPPRGSKVGLPETHDGSELNESQSPLIEPENVAEEEESRIAANREKENEKNAQVESGKSNKSHILDSRSELDEESESGSHHANDIIPSDDEEELVNLTAVGRIYSEDGKRLVVDEARWRPTEPKDLGREFSVLVEKDGRKKERVFLASKYLQKVFGSVCKRKHYPSASITVDGISFTEPYAPLYFHYQDMVRISEQPHILEGFEPVQCQRDMAGLKYWYDKWVLPEHDKVRESINHGSVAYEDLWAVYQPGELMYGRDDFGQDRIYVIAGTIFRAGFGDVINDQDNEEFGMMSSMLPIFNSFFNAKKRFAVECWCVGWDGSSQTFTRKSVVRSIPGYSGTRRITDLDFYPMRFYKKGDQDAIERLLVDLEKRGRFWRDLISSSSTCMHHNGPAMEMNSDPKSLGDPKAENINMNERVIVDNDGWALFGDKASIPAPLKGMLGGFMNNSKIESAIIQGGFDEQYASYDKHPVEEEFDQLQAQLCPSDIYCCSIRTMKWYQVTINNLRPIEWKQEAIQSLVVDDRTKRLVRGLVEEHKKSRVGEEIMSDFIPNKGQGLVIVLHGPPGVGKTLTAECISEFTGKPLYSINIGELSSEQNVASRLETIFDLASRWDAVLLMDEADVVLEKRSYENMQRNGVVSVFLRMLEYYKGILFLTTNRLGTMDIAFQSRVTLAIKYNSLTPALRRKIWTNFISRLSESERVAKEQLLENLDDIQEWELNGRQIRNVIQMAQSLAHAETRMRGSLRFEHVEQVASETLKFQDYFDEEYRESRLKLGEMKDRGFREKRMTQPAGSAMSSTRSSLWN